jgi:hypothetical protein
MGQGRAELFAELKPCLPSERSAQPYPALAFAHSEGVVHRDGEGTRRLIEVVRTGR